MEYVPGAHPVQNDDPAYDVKVPASHVTQDDDPEVDENFAAGQSRHMAELVAPSFEEYFPNSH